MDVIVDGERNFRLEGSPPDVLSAVVAISGFLREKGRAILVVKVDDKSVESHELKQTLSGKPLSEVAVLEVQSEEIATMVGQTLDQLSQVLPELPAACHSLAEIFQGSTPEQGYEPFQRLAEIWGQIKTRQLQVVNAIEIPSKSLCLNDKSLTVLHEELNEYLEEAASALEAGDCVLLGDLLEYELAPRAELETEIVAMLKSCARGQTR